MVPPSEAGVIRREGEPIPEETAFIFPGQATQCVGMGRKLYEGSPAAREVFYIADETLGISLSDICFNGPENRLGQNDIVQPAIVATSLAAFAAVKEANPQLEANYVAGHSLGQLAAVAAAGLISMRDAIFLAGERGRITQEFLSTTSGGMAALLGASLETIEEVCRRTEVFIANINCPGQIIVSGHKKNIAEAGQLAKQRGARVVPLPISGAFHSPLMEPVEEIWRGIVERIPFGESSIYVVLNQTGLPSLSAKEIRESIIRSLTERVDWIKSVKTIISYGVKEAYIFSGSQREVLAGMLRKISDQIRGIPIVDFQSIKHMNLGFS